MANHFRQTAQSLREAAGAKDALSPQQRDDLNHAADILCRLEQLKRDLIASDPEDEGESNRLSAEFMSLLGLHTGS